MRLSYCLMLVFLLGSSYVTAQNTTKTSSEGGQNQSALVNSVNGLISMIEGLPVIGTLTTSLLKSMTNMIADFELITNGALGRVMGGALPCTLSIEDKLVCTGVDSTNGGVGKLIMEIVNSIPSLLLPGFVKQLIGVLISAVIDPTFDVTFGGIMIA